MKNIIRIERKRILNSKFLVIFFAVIILFSISSSSHAIKRFEIWDKTGIVVTWKENLIHGKESVHNKFLDENYLKYFIENKESHLYVDETNVEDLVEANYDGKSLQELSDKEIKNFYSQRLFNIKEML